MTDNVRFNVRLRGTDWPTTNYPLMYCYYSVIRLTGQRCLSGLICSGRIGMFYVFSVKVLEKEAFICHLTKKILKVQGSSHKRNPSRGLKSPGTTERLNIICVFILTRNEELSQKIQTERPGTRNKIWNLLIKDFKK